MPSTTFDRDKFLEESERQLEKLRHIETYGPKTPINWKDVQEFLDKSEKEWVIVKSSNISEPFWGKVVNK